MQDTSFARIYREWLPDQRLGSPLVDHLPIVPGVPTPRDVLGYHIGAPKTLTYYADQLRYYRALADATAAPFTRNPMGLARALEKISAAGAPTHKITRGAAHMCIVDPMGSRLAAKSGFVADLFATHPPMAMRLTRLRGMAYQAEKAERVSG